MKTSTYLAAALALPLLAGCSAEALSAMATAAANAQRPTYTRAFITTFTVNAMPYAAPNGVAFDLTGAPDPMLVIVDPQTNQAVWTGQAIQDVAPGRLPVSWRVAYEVPLGKPFVVAVYDQDPTGRELMFSSQPFTAQQVAATGQNTYTIQSPNGQVNAVVTLTFQ